MEFERGVLEASELLADGSGWLAVSVGLAEAGEYAAGLSS